MLNIEMWTSLAFGTYVYVFELATTFILSSLMTPTGFMLFKFMLYVVVMPWGRYVQCSQTKPKLKSWVDRV